MGSRARRLARNRLVTVRPPSLPASAAPPSLDLGLTEAMIARLRGEPARGPSLFSQTLDDPADVATFERATPEQEAFIRTMLEGVDADIFKSETGLEKGVALPGYDPPRITSIEAESTVVARGGGILETMLSLAAEKNRLQHEAREGFAVELAERIQADVEAAATRGLLYGTATLDVDAAAKNALAGAVEWLRKPSAEAYEVPPPVADDEFFK